MERKIAIRARAIAFNLPLDEGAIATARAETLGVTGLYNQFWQRFCQKRLIRDGSSRGSSFKDVKPKLDKRLVDLPDLLGILPSLGFARTQKRKGSSFMIEGDD